jgi:glycosyltransferase involved in cell wall biosynthesis
MKPVSSLHLDAGREFRGGQRQVLYLLEGLRQRGHRVLLCSPRQSPLHERAAAAGIPCAPLTLRSGLDFASAVRLVRLVRDGDFDVVHAHDAHSHSIALAAQGIGRHAALSRHLVVTRRSIGQAAGRLDRLKYGAPGTTYIAISNAVRDSLARLGVQASRVAVVPSGVASAPAPQSGDDAWGLAGRGLRIVGSVGRLTREKNHALLLHAYALVRRTHPDTHLLIAGDGPLRAALERRAGHLGIAPHVTFAGHVEDPASVYAALSLFVLSSDVEGLCTALLDAMGVGVPAVATAVGGVLDIARHGDSALVVPPRDAAALAGAVTRLLDQPDLAARIVEGGRRVAARHGVDRMVEGTLAVYGALTREPPPRESLTRDSALPRRVAPATPPSAEAR